MKNPCWKGYKPLPSKKFKNKNGKSVPNCVREDRMLVDILLEAVKKTAVNKAPVKSGQTATVKNPIGKKSSAGKIVSTIAGAIAPKATTNKTAKPTETPNPVDVIKKTVKSLPRKPKPVLSPEEASAKDAERKSNKNKQARAKRKATKTELETLRAKVGNQPHNPDHETIANNIAKNNPHLKPYMDHGLTPSKALHLHDINRVETANRVLASKDNNLNYYMKMGYSPDEARIKHAQNGDRPGIISQIKGKIDSRIRKGLNLESVNDPDAVPKPDKGNDPLVIKPPKKKKPTGDPKPTTGIDTTPTLNKSI